MDILSIAITAATAIMLLIVFYQQARIQKLLAIQREAMIDQLKGVYFQLAFLHYWNTQDLEKLSLEELEKHAEHLHSIYPQILKVILEGGAPTSLNFGSFPMESKLTH